MNQVLKLKKTKRRRRRRRRDIIQKSMAQMYSLEADARRDSLNQIH
jgi:hypothetical protein